MQNSAQFSVVLMRINGLSTDDHHHWTTTIHVTHEWLVISWTNLPVTLYLQHRPN